MLPLELLHHLVEVTEATGDIFSLLCLSWVCHTIRQRICSYASTILTRLSWRRHLSRKGIKSPIHYLLASSIGKCTRCGATFYNTGTTLRCRKCRALMSEAPGVLMNVKHLPPRSLFKGMFFSGWHGRN